MAETIVARREESNMLCESERTVEVTTKSVLTATIPDALALCIVLYLQIAASWTSYLLARHNLLQPSTPFLWWYCKTTGSVGGTSPAPKTTGGPTQSPSRTFQLPFLPRYAMFTHAQWAYSILSRTRALEKLPQSGRRDTGPGQPEIHLYELHRQGTGIGVHLRVRCDGPVAEAQVIQWCSLLADKNLLCALPCGRLWMPQLHQPGRTERSWTRESGASPPLCVHCGCTWPPRRAAKFVQAREHDGKALLGRPGWTFIIDTVHPSYSILNELTSLCVVQGRRGKQLSIGFDGLSCQKSSFDAVRILDDEDYEVFTLL